MTKKYIDADLLRKEIEKRHRYQSEQYHDTKPDGRPNDGWAESLAIMGELEDILSLIDSLQQEQDIIVINKKDWEAQEQFRKNKDFGKPLQQEQPCDTCTNDKGCVTCKDGDMNSIKGWVARDKANDLYFFTYKPHRTDGVFHSEISEDILHLSNDMFPELSWETEPIEVELLPKKLM